MGASAEIIWTFMVDYAKGWGVRGHMHDCFQMYHCLSGCGFMRLGDREITLNENDCLIIHPRQYHEVFPVESGQLITIDTKFMIQEGGLADALLHAPQVISIPGTHFRELQQTMRDEWVTGAAYGKEMASLLLEQTLYLFLRGNVSRSAHPPFYQQLQQQTQQLTGLARSMAAYLSVHFLEDLTLDQIAEHFRYSKNYLCKTFKKASRYTIDEYINCLRINKAYDLVCYTDHTLTWISTQCSFSSIHYFSRIFHRIVGISASQARDQKQNSLHTDIQRHGTFHYRYCNRATSGQEPSPPDSP